MTIGIRPEAFEDDVTGRRGQEGSTASRSRCDVDVIEWLGNEQYAYIPYDAPSIMVAGLEELERELDSERMRSQLVVALEPMSRIVGRRRRHALARPPPDADLRSPTPATTSPSPSKPEFTRALLDRRRGRRHGHGGGMVVGHQRLRRGGARWCRRTLRLDRGAVVRRAVVGDRRGRRAVPRGIRDRQDCARGHCMGRRPHLHPPRRRRVPDEHGDGHAVGGSSAGRVGGVTGAEQSQREGVDPSRREHLARAAVERSGQLG